MFLDRFGGLTFFYLVHLLLCWDWMRIWAKSNLEDGLMPENDQEGYTHIHSIPIRR